MNPIQRLKPRRPARIIVAEACLLRAIDQPPTPLRHADIGERVTLTPEDADSVTGAGRGFYLDVSDDRTKGKLTATAELVAQIEARAKLHQEAQLARERRAAAAQMQTSAPPTDFAAAVAQAVASELDRRGLKG